MLPVLGVRAQRWNAYPPNRIAVLRALQLGDLLCAVPALRALRAAFPAAEISLVGLPWAAAFVERFSAYLDRFIEFPGFPGLPERTPQLSRIPAWLAQMQSEHFDLAIQLQGSGSFVNPLMVLWNARINAGYYLPSDYCPDAETFMPYPQSEPEVRRHLLLMEYLGFAPMGDELEFPVTTQDREALEHMAAAGSVRGGECICIHPGARYASRRWSPDCFAAVADRLAALGFQIVLTGTAEERNLTRAVAARMHRPAINLAGQTTLGAMAALLAGARLLISNDTGVSHMAAALNVPSVVIALSSDVSRWAPLDGARHRVLYHPLGCSPCDYVTCPIEQPCISTVTVGEVYQEAMQLLETTRNELAYA